MRTSTSRFYVKDHSYVGQTRRAIRDLATEAGFESDVLARVDIIVTELATNLVKHAQGAGEILVLDGPCSGDATMRLVSIDRGPGIADIDDVMIDGHSTAGTLGGGLGAIKRLSDTFEISSSPGRGTIVLAGISLSSEREPHCTTELAAVSVAHPGHDRCGDGVSIAASSDLTSILVVDGSGHGEYAAEAADRAAQVFLDKPFDDLKVIVDRVHKALGGTRGAAIALMQLDHLQDQIQYCGVGNITGKVCMRYESKGCVSAPGIAGSQLGTIKTFTYDWGPGARLLLYSDGIKSCATLGNPAGKSVMLEAAEVYRDHGRLTDDTTVVVLRDKRRS